MYALKISITLAILLTTTFVFAQRPEMNTDRPDMSNSPQLIPAGAFQIESGTVIESAQFKNTSMVSYTFNNTLIKFGVNENFEVHVDASYLGIDSLENSGAMSRVFSPLTIGGKIKLMEETNLWPQAALIAHADLRSGAGSEYAAAELVLAFSQTLTNTLGLVYNLGINWSSPKPTRTYTITIGYEATEKTGLFVESYGFFPEGGRSDHRVDAGMTLKIRPMLQADLSVGVGLSSASPAYFLSSGLSCRLFK
jgi:hypothetical protein